MLTLIKSLKQGDRGFNTAREKEKDRGLSQLREAFLEPLSDAQVAVLHFGDGTNMTVAMHNAEGGTCNCCGRHFETIIAYDVYELVSTESAGG